MPLAASLLTVLIALSPDSISPGAARPLWVVSGGVGGAALLWLVAALWTNRTIAADRLSISNYQKLKARCVELECALDPGTHGPANAAPAACQTANYQATAFCEATQHVEVVKRMLNPLAAESHGSLWAHGTGYLAAWERLHRADERLLEVRLASNSPRHALGAALHDYARLKGSTIDNRDLLERDLQVALAVVVPGSESLFPEPRYAVATKGTPADYLAVFPLVRRVINTHRDGEWAGLLRLRKRVFLAATLAGTVAYLLLVLAIMGGASQATIQAVSVFYLVGALVGMLNHLRAAQDDKAHLLEDYGLSTARLLMTPIISGLAAVLGVFLITLVPVLVDINAATNQATPTPTATATATATPTSSGGALPAANVAEPTHTPTPTPTPTPPVPGALTTRTGVVPSAVQGAEATATPTTPPSSTPTPTAPVPPQSDGATGISGGSSARSGSTVSLSSIFTLRPVALLLAAIFGLTPALLFSRLEQADRHINNLLSSEPANQRLSPRT